MNRIRKQRYLTTVEAARLHDEDTRNELKLQEMQLAAQKGDRPDRAPRGIVRTSKVDEAYLMKDNTENVIRAKLDRIGYASRVTPEDMVQKKVLSRPEQAEIDTYNLRLKQLGKDTNANAADEVPPVLYLPETEEDWTTIGPEYALQPLLDDKQNIEESMAFISHELDILKHKSGIIELSSGITPAPKGKKKNLGDKPKPLKFPPDLKSSISDKERDLREFKRSLDRVEAAIKTAKQLRRQYVEELTSDYQAEMENYIQQISVLTSLGLSTQRLPNESDEDYIQRMHDNVQDITTQEQLFDGGLYLIKELMAKLKSLNLSLDKVESITKLLPDDSKEWLLAHWPKVTKEFVKTFGTNPFRVRVEDVTEFFKMMYRTSSGSDMSRSTLKQYRDELDQEYDMQLFLPILKGKQRRLKE